MNKISPPPVVALTHRWETDRWSALNCSTTWNETESLQIKNKQLAPHIFHGLLFYRLFLIHRPVLSNLFDTAGHLVNFPPAGGPQSRGPWRARGARAYKGVWGGASSGVQGQSPWSGSQGGEAPLKLKHFLLPNVQWKPQICQFFFKFGNAKDHQTLLNFASWFHLTNHRTKTTIYVGRWRATWNPLAGRVRPAGWTALP